MRVSVYVLLMFFVWGRLQSEVQSIKIKTVLKTIKKSPAVLKVVKKIKKLPKKLPKKALTRLQRLGLKNVLGIRDNLNPDTWSKIEESIGFFMKIGKFLKYRNISTYNMKDPIGWRDEEFMICKPNTLGAECHTPFGFGSSNEGYKFCYLKGGSYDYCSCKIRTPMKYWILFMKNVFNQIFEDLNPETVKVVKPIIDTTVNAVEKGPEAMQWGLIILSLVVLSILVISIIGRIIFNYRKLKKVGSMDEAEADNE